MINDKYVDEYNNRMQLCLMCAEVAVRATSKNPDYGFLADIIRKTIEGMHPSSIKARPTSMVDSSKALIEFSYLHLSTGEHRHLVSVIMVLNDMKALAIKLALADLTSTIKT